MSGPKVFSPTTSKFEISFFHSQVSSFQAFQIWEWKPKVLNIHWHKSLLNPLFWWIETTIWKWAVSESANPEVYGNVLHDEVLQDVTCFPHHRGIFSYFFNYGRDCCDVFDCGCDCWSGMILRDEMEHSKKMAGMVKVENYRAMFPKNLDTLKSRPVS